MATRKPDTGGPRPGVLLLVLTAAAAFGQPRPPAGAVQVQLGIEKLRRVGSVLMIAAHPDDENTALLAYFAQGHKLRTGYLSLTRGEGGQNLIGSEQGELMGLIRTHELLAARRLDGAEQFFSRAIDFGFSKTAKETLEKWGREQVLGDVVWTIRRFQPDVILLRFSGTPRDGHGQHQSSAILGKEAFTAAADPKRFPAQLQWVKPWQARRLYHNLPTFTRAMEREAAAVPDRIVIDTGEYDPRLGYSFAEIAGASRSMHRSQAMGTMERKGSSVSYLALIAGDRGEKDPFDGIDTSWRRVPGGEAVDADLAKAAEAFRLDAPESTIPALLEARRKLALIDGEWAKRKLREVESVVIQAAGLWLDASAERPIATPGGRTSIRCSAVNRSGAAVSITGFQIEGRAGMQDRSVPSGELRRNRPLEWTIEEALPADDPYSQPFWLRKQPTGTSYVVDDVQIASLPEQPADLQAHFRLRFGEQEIDAVRPVLHRFVDPARGELTRPFVIAPAVAVGFSDSSVLFPSPAARGVEVQLRANGKGLQGKVRIEAPQGWSVAPASQEFALTEDGETKAVRFQVTPPAGSARAELKAVADIATGSIRHGMRVITYDHLPPLTTFPEARVPVARADVKILSRRVGYVMGAGDDIPQALRQLGVEVTMLTADDLARADLSRYDAIVTGVRAFDVRKDLQASVQRLFDYVASGGTMVAQYNRVDRGSAGPPRPGPYPIRLGSDRVTVEEAPLTPVNPDHRVLQAPNRIEPADYDGWIQERGLYFAASWDAKYEPIWETNDPGEKATRGAALYARHGKGVYIYTSLSWFRQLPAGVPGATRIFANLLSAGKLTQ